MRYARPTVFPSATGRRIGFEVIPNYREDDATTEYQGAWNEETQTLTAAVRLSVGSENVVYVRSGTPS